MTPKKQKKRQSIEMYRLNRTIQQKTHSKVFATGTKTNQLETQQQYYPAKIDAVSCKTQIRITQQKIARVFGKDKANHASLENEKENLKNNRTI